MLTPVQLFEELLRFREAPAQDTQQLASFSHDELCVITTEHFNSLMAAYEKYQHIPYLVQGPRDKGVDVLLKGTKDDEPEKYAAFQIKSYAEVADKKADLSKALKAGTFDAGERFSPGLERYYILLFGDAKKHFKRISAITNEFARAKDVRIIGPRHLLTFVKMSETKVHAIVDRLLSPDDFVRKQARAEVQGCEEAELYFILTCICWVLENSNDTFPDDFFLEDSRMAELDRLYGSGTAARMLDRYSDGDLEVYASPHSVRLRTEHYPAIRALYFDLQVRYEESEDELFQHLVDFLKL